MPNQNVCLHNYFQNLECNDLWNCLRLTQYSMLRLGCRGRYTLNQLSQSAVHMPKHKHKWRTNTFNLIETWTQIFGKLSGQKVVAFKCTPTLMKSCCHFVSISPIKFALQFTQLRTTSDLSLPFRGVFCSMMCIRRVDAVWGDYYAIRGENVCGCLGDATYVGHEALSFCLPNEPTWGCTWLWLHLAG